MTRCAEQDTMNYLRKQILVSVLKYLDHIHDDQYKTLGIVMSITFSYYQIGSQIKSFAKPNS